MLAFKPPLIKNELLLPGERHNKEPFLNLIEAGRSMVENRIHVCHIICSTGNNRVVDFLIL